MEQNKTVAIPSAPTLVIDGSGSQVFAGVLDQNLEWRSKTCREGAPLEALFPTVETCLLEAQLHLSDLRGYIYNSGPGSVLGLRLCAMAIETWTRLYPESKSLFAYSTLQYAARVLSTDTTPDNRALLISDWKKGAWNAVYFDAHKVGPTEVVDTETIAAFEGPLYHLPQRKGWQSPPDSAQTVELDLSQLPRILAQSDLLKQTESVELYTSAFTTFQKWTPERHRAPV